MILGRAEFTSANSFDFLHSAELISANCQICVCLCGIISENLIQIRTK